MLCCSNWVPELKVHTIKKKRLKYFFLIICILFLIICIFSVSVYVCICIHAHISLPTGVFWCVSSLPSISHFFNFLFAKAALDKFWRTVETVSPSPTFHVFSKRWLEMRKEPFESFGGKWMMAHRCLYGSKTSLNKHWKRHHLEQASVLGLVRCHKFPTFYCESYWVDSQLSPSIVCAQYFFFFYDIPCINTHQRAVGCRPRMSALTLSLWACKNSQVTSHSCPHVQTLCLYVRVAHRSTHTRALRCILPHLPKKIIQHFHLRAERERAPRSPGAGAKHLALAYRQPPDVSAPEVPSKIEVVLHFVILSLFGSGSRFHASVRFYLRLCFAFRFLFISIPLRVPTDLHRSVVKHI